MITMYEINKMLFSKKHLLLIFALQIIGFLQFLVSEGHQKIQILFDQGHKDFQKSF